MDSNTQFNVSNQDIDVMVVIDTDYVINYMANTPNKKPSTDMTKPVGIDHNSQYMIVSSTNVVTGQASADLNFKAKNGDTVRFRGTSIYQNSDDAIIIYGVKNYSGTDVFHDNPIDYVSVERKQAAVPDHKQPNGLPALAADLTFSSLDATVGVTGTGSYYIYFALYTLDTGNKQTLYSYCYWDPTITVH
ncbi:MAG: inclusion body family protein [Chryseobacterium sp.]|uniref:inclusion body family protein n=1 Tax=Chryseobacterium sp. TaxID=1871047 RepID=UPI0025C6CA99|nr:inclusion body family protein [Chryseobacterium sp.]MCJ7934270.1 inclusion body family protein [Chryseobacterium sp.]